MTVVDIRNLITDSNVELIEISDTTIYYAEEKNEEGHNSLFLLEYNRVTRTERIVANYFLSNPTFVQHFFSFPNEIIVVMENSESLAWILRVDKKTGAEKNLAQVHFIGSFADCTALDESHIILYTAENEEHRKLFKEYKKLTGFDRVAYLYDLDDEEYYYVKDARICNLTSQNLITFDVNGQRQLLVLQPYGNEKEKEKCYQNTRWLGDSINDNVWLCPLIDFIVAIKTAEKELPLQILLSAGTSGLVRYAGMDEYNLYFRVKHFPTNDQRICAVSKATVRKAVVAELNLAEGEQAASFCIDTQAAKVYRVAEHEDSYEITGELNTAIHTQYSKELGDFVACIEDRFILARYVISDETDSFEFVSIFDSKTEEQKSYECRCAVQENTVVLY